MLSTTSPSGVQRRRTQHRRQLSTPATYEAPKTRQIPTNIQQRRQLRSGMSLDLRGLNLETAPMPGPVSVLGQAQPGQTNTTSFHRQDGSVSITNLGQTSQHTMQVAQPHSQPQPGPQGTFSKSSVHTSLPSPRTPQRTLRNQSPRQPLPQSPTKEPSEEQLKQLREHIQSVYGSNGPVFINIQVQPTATPQKQSQVPSYEQAPLQADFSSMANINLKPTSSAMTFDFENPEVDLGYESSSYYTSDALSPSPISSPNQRSSRSFLEGIEEIPTEEMTFSQQDMYPASDASMSMDGYPLGSAFAPQPTLLPELEFDATLEFTGISPEDVQRYISEQDATTNKWTCLYPECGKVFGRRENIRSHVQTHLGDRQFKCNGCGKRFVRQHDLKRHAKIHTGNKPYKCPCGAGFARQDALTRHRQRGMCVGGFADVVRRQAKRGRPKKQRPDMEERTDKANRTRRALASASSSVTADSPGSYRHSSPPLEDILETQPLTKSLPETASFNDPINESSNPFSFETAPSSYDAANAANSSFLSSTSYASEVAPMHLLQHLSETNRHTPPMSPANCRPHSSDSANDAKFPIASSPLKGSSTPSRSSIQSNTYSTPPTSPAEMKDEFEELFHVVPDNSCSQFDLEMKAMDDFSVLDNFVHFDM
ncbi:hypothetical protein DM02DRAFT_721304 [Periconia macrospinosa]|uniref:C2H2-type domain-containing protein n=1 Tax=Periconia macrospinosa TaxID=97972 RepID=A0A2V1D8F0_9PLEO|nr:hypothetical protein DM02DRAFT_721304 [Periconia macrospinosa]